MSNVHYLSDPHVMHQLVAEDRGFASSQEHDQRFCEQFVGQVRSQDTSVFLGDIAVVRGVERLRAALALIATLPGEKILILGNHDQGHPMHRDAAKWMPVYLEVFTAVMPFARRRIAGQQVMLSHFPYTADADHTERHGGRDTYAQYRLRDVGNWLLHGHTHSSAVRGEHRRSIHVGLDAWDMRPVEQGEIEAIIHAEEDLAADPKPAA